MIIRKEQVDAFSRIQREQFVRRLEDLLKDALPEYFFEVAQLEFHELVARYVGEAIHLGVSLQNEIGNYVQMRVEAGTAFDEALNNDADFRLALESRETPSAHKLALIERRLFSLK